MKDAFGREIRYLRVSVTDRCNLRCRYCMPAAGVPDKGHGNILSFERIAEIVTAATELGVSKVRLTGGEPLVRRGIVDLVRTLAVPGTLRDLAMTTNGTLLADLAKPLKDAGLMRLNISLDSLDPDTYRAVTRGGDLALAKRGLRAALDCGFPVKLNAVLQRGVNEREIPDLVDLTRDLPVELRFIELMPMNGDCAGDAFLPGSAVLDAVPELRPLESDGKARRFALPGAAGTVGLIEPASRPFCAACDRLRLTADGKLKPCLLDSREIPLDDLHGDKLTAALRDAILAKPAAHGALSFTGQSPAGRTMNRIGG